MSNLRRAVVGVVIRQDKPMVAVADIEQLHEWLVAALYKLGKPVDD